MNDSGKSQVRMPRNGNIPHQTDTSTAKVVGPSTSSGAANVSGASARGKRKPKAIKVIEEDAEEPICPPVQKNAAKLRSKTAPLTTDPASIAEIIAKRKSVLNYWRFLNAKTAKRRVPIGPWKPEDIPKIFPGETSVIPEDLSRFRYMVESEVSDDAVIEKIRVEPRTCGNGEAYVPPVSPGASGCGISLKLKKIGSAWKPIAEEDSSRANSAEDTTDDQPDVATHRAPKKKKHRRNDERPVENGATHEERKLLKKRRKLLKQLKKSLKRQEELERAVEQSKERSKKADSKEDSDMPSEPPQPTESVPAVATTSGAGTSSTPQKAVKKAVKPIAVVAGQPQAKRKPVDPLTSETPRKKVATEESLEPRVEKPVPSCEKPDDVDVDSSARNHGSVRESLLKQLLEFESAKALSNSNSSDNNARGRPKRNAVADSLIKKLLDETSKNSTAVLEKKSQSILSKFLEGEDLLGQSFPMSDEDVLKTKTTASLDGSTSSDVSLNIADLPPAPASEVQYLRQVLNSQYYSIPSSLVVPRDQLFHFFAYPILCFCSLLAKQTALYGLVGREPDAILDGRVIVFATKQLPDILEHPKNYLPEILGSTLSSDSTSSSPSHAESSDAKPKDDVESSSLLKSLLEQNETAENGECTDLGGGSVDSTENADGREISESSRNEVDSVEAQCDSKTSSAPHSSGASKKPVPCLVKLPKESAPLDGSSCDTTRNDADVVSSTSKLLPVEGDCDESSKDNILQESLPSVEETFGVIRVRGVEDVNKMSVEDLISLGLDMRSTAGSGSGHLLVDLLRKEQRCPSALSHTEAGYWRPKGVSANSKLPPGLRRNNWSPHSPAASLVSQASSSSSAMGHTMQTAAMPMMSPVGQPAQSYNMPSMQQRPPPPRPLPVVSSSLSLSHENVKNWLNAWVKTHRGQHVSNAFDPRTLFGPNTCGFDARLPSPTTDRPMSLNMTSAAHTAERSMNMGLPSPSITPDRAFNMCVNSPSSSSASFVPHSPISPLGFMSDSRLNQLLSSPPLYSPPSPGHALQHRMATPPPPLQTPLPPPSPAEQSMFTYPITDYHAFASNSFHQQTSPSMPSSLENAYKRRDVEKVGSSSSAPGLTAEDQHPILSEALTTVLARDGRRPGQGSRQMSRQEADFGCTGDMSSSSTRAPAVDAHHCGENSKGKQYAADGDSLPAQTEENMTRSKSAKDSAVTENGTRASDADSSLSNGENVPKSDVSMRSSDNSPQEPSISSVERKDAAEDDAEMADDNDHRDLAVEDSTSDDEPKKESAMPGMDGKHVAKKEEPSSSTEPDVKARLEAHTTDKKRPLPAATSVIKKLKGEEETESTKGCFPDDTVHEDDAATSSSMKTVAEAYSSLDSPSSPPPERLPDVENMGVLERMLVNVRKDIRDLDYQVKEKEREWNLLIHEKKKMEEYYLRLRRKREVDSLETTGTLPSSLPLANEKTVSDGGSTAGTSEATSKVENTVNTVLSSGLSGRRMKTLLQQGHSAATSRTSSLMPDMVFGGNAKPSRSGGSLNMMQSLAQSNLKTPFPTSPSMRMRNMWPVPDTPTTTSASFLPGVPKAGTAQADLLEIYNEMVRQQQRQNSYQQAEKLQQALTAGGGSRLSNSLQKQAFHLQQALSSNAGAAEAAAAAMVAAASQQYVVPRNLDASLSSGLETTRTRHHLADRPMSRSKASDVGMVGTRTEMFKLRDPAKPFNQPPHCHGCRQRVAQFVCAGCNAQWYCSRDCQVSDWDEHAERCMGG